MILKNKQLIIVGQLLQKMTLPAQVSRARTKIIFEIQKALDDSSKDEIQLVEDNNGIIDGNKVTWENAIDENSYAKQHDDLMNEEIKIEINNVTLFNKFVSFIENWNEDVSGEDAEAFDILCNSLGIQKGYNTMVIEKKITFYAYMRDETESIYVSFNGTVDEDGIPYTSYNITNNDKYLENIKEFRKNKNDFENVVFDEADRIIADKQATTTTTTTTTVK